MRKLPRLFYPEFYPETCPGSPEAAMGEVAAKLCALAWMGTVRALRKGAPELQFPSGGPAMHGNASLHLGRKQHQPVQAGLHIYPLVMEKGVTLKAAIADVLAISDHKSQEVVTPWPGIVTALRTTSSTRATASLKTFKASYQRYLDIALLHLNGRNAAKTGAELTERILIHQRYNQKPGKVFGQPLTPWMEMPKSRLECALALKKFLEYAVSRHRQPQCWLLSEADYSELKGDGGERADRAVLSDDQVMQLITLLPEEWANVVKSVRVFGFRAWEQDVTVRKLNGDGEQQLFVTKGKTYITRSGIKKRTKPRWLEPIPVNGTTFNWWRHGTP